ncbi:hypothetical protein H206_05565 [Candidatus Electrothrix aarhusensis]|uniref:Uncharacterized protein n=1 Tax=Candidatus Electrothrix aarhusensis TaxID=1859131 RepID=A0A3S3RA50_9BACT|nr:hypothetical protein H206_05565 [Candidatus Electrothrix aarhusensis]
MSQLNGRTSWPSLIWMVWPPTLALTAIFLPLICPLRAMVFFFTASLLMESMTKVPRKLLFFFCCSMGSGRRLLRA